MARRHGSRIHSGDLSARPANCVRRPFGHRGAVDGDVHRRHAGAGLFDLDVQLVAIVLPCLERLVAIDARAVEQLVEYAHSTGQRLLERYGMRLETLTDAERSYFGAATGLLVREVWSGSEADLAGVRPGDLVVQWAGRPVATLEDRRAARRVLERLAARFGANASALTVRAQRKSARPRRRP
jgi:hypothetical protein